MRDAWGESNLLSPPPGTKPYPRPPTWPAPSSPDSTPGFPCSLCPDSLDPLNPLNPTSGLFHGLLLHSTPDLQGRRDLRSPHCACPHKRLSSLDRGQAKDWRYSGAGPRFGDPSVGSTLEEEEEATTDGGLSSQLLFCPMLLDFCLHSISLCLGRVQDTHHRRVSVC